MQINLSMRHGHLSQQTQDKITAKLEKLTRFKERMTSVEATIDLQHEDSPEFELRVSIEHNSDLVARSKGDTLWSAVDTAIGKIEEQMRRHKEKMSAHRASGRRTEVVAADEMPEEGED
ncbi:MAG: ribosome-associated translation inhibitor RaiA [Planctomycetales bacterium]|nr:ribosome-associated translation inhibitor RaiA [Planctomycetales bacterium]